MNVKQPGFKICDQKGFHVTFENGWTISAQFGRGNYADNYDHPDYRTPVPPSRTAEVAAWPNGHGLIAFEGGDTVLARQTPAQVLALMNDISARPEQPDLPTN